CQAEDGIRAFHLTGVQTCALPISFLTFIDPHDQPSTSISYDPCGMPSQVSGGGNPTQTFVWDGTAKTITAKINDTYPTVSYLDSSEERRVGKGRRSRGARGN